MESIVRYRRSPVVRRKHEFALTPIIRSDDRCGGPRRQVVVTSPDS